MKYKILVYIALFMLVAVIQSTPVTKDPKEFLQDVSNRIFNSKNVFSKLIYKFLTNETEYAEISDQLKNEINDLHKYLKSSREYAVNIVDADVKSALNKLYRATGILILEPDDIVRFNASIEAMENNTYNDLVLPYYTSNDTNIAYSPDIINEITFAEEAEIKYYWLEWRNIISDDAAENLFVVVDLFKKAARLLDLPVLELYNEDYNNELINEMYETMKQLRPFYQQLHAFIRNQMFKMYGAGVITPKGLIPDHLYEQRLLSVWANNSNFEPNFPYAELPQYDEILNDESETYNSKKLLEIAEDFYTSIGFEPLTAEFWNNKITLRNQTEDEKTCFEYTFDYSPDASFFYCDGVYFEALMSNHDNIGRMHFALEKQNLPAYHFDNEVLNRGVLEAVELAASTPEHSKKLGLLNKDYEFNEKTMLNRNFRKATETLFELPRYYAYAKIMEGLLQGTLDKTEVNKYYWKLMEEYAGVEPPDDRFSSSLDLPESFYSELLRSFDFSSKFTSIIRGYQFYKALCQRISHVGVLNKCDFYGNKDAGKLLKEMISLGSTKPLHEVLRVLLPENTKLDAAALLDYYAPIYEWLKEHVKKSKLHVGWEHSTKKLSESSYDSEEEAKLFVKESSDKVYALYNQISSDLFAKKDQIEDTSEFWLTSDSAIAANELKQISVKAKKFNGKSISDKKTRRALKQLSNVADVFVLGKDLEDFLLNKKVLKDTATDRDIKIYNDTSDDDDNDDESKLIALYPEINEIFLNSSDPEELKYYWEAWRLKNGIWAKEYFFSTLLHFQKAAEILKTTPTNIWESKYFSSSAITNISDKLKPLYEQLHAFIRASLIKKYGADVLSEDSPIPEHLYQQVLLQVWTNHSIIEDYYSWHKLPPYDKFVKSKEYDGLKILKEADKFYQSLGLEPLDDEFWKDRVAPQSTDTENATICHATVYDMIPKAYLKYCEGVSFKKFLQAHGYMGRIHYAHGKRELPAYSFNSYSMEYGIGEAAILSASTPKHLKAIGLSGDFEFSDDVLMNRLIRMGIHTLMNVHLYSVRAKVLTDNLENTLDKNDLNKYYWQQMLSIGVEPPMDRSEENFDLPYEFYTDLEQNHHFKKFISEVKGYLFYEIFCDISGHKGDLNNCDFYNSKEVGTMMQKMMQLGSSPDVSETIQTLLEKDKQSDSSILKYYEPMMKWLQEKNKQLNATVGLGTTSKRFWRIESINDNDNDTIVENQ